MSGEAQQQQQPRLRVHNTEVGSLIEAWTRKPHMSCVCVCVCVCVSQSPHQRICQVCIREWTQGSGTWNDWVRHAQTDTHTHTHTNGRDFVQGTCITSIVCMMSASFAERLLDRAGSDVVAARRSVLVACQKDVGALRAQLRQIHAAVTQLQAVHADPTQSQQGKSWLMGNISNTCVRPGSTLFHTQSQD